MKSIEITAKKVQDAINQGLEQLGVRLDEVTVEVLEQGGLFRKAKVRITVDAEAEKEKEAPKPEKVEKPQKPAKTEIADKPAEKKPEEKKPAEKKSEEKKPAEKKQAPKKEQKTEQKPAPKQKPEKAEKPVKTEKAEQPQEKTGDKKNSAESAAAREHAFEFVKGCIERMGFEGVSYETSDDGTISIDAPAGDDSLIIGRHGETLSALAYLAETGARAEKNRVNITVDCNGYRERRQQSLAGLARRKADECVRRHRKIKLEPMERIDRRTVHFALNDDKRVITSSEGKEPYRCVVIIPKSRDRRDGREEKFDKAENETTED